MGRTRHIRRDIENEQPEHEQHTYVTRSKKRRLERALKTKNIDLLLDEEDEGMSPEDYEAMTQDLDEQ
jgi:ABC-type branched-subunit amino acid transport system ATPase component